MSKSSLQWHRFWIEDRSEEGTKKEESTQFKDKINNKALRLHK
jgi:hypothetical protein